VINEFVFNHNGTNTHEYIEIAGKPNTAYGNYRLVLLEGDNGSNRGTVDQVITPALTNSLGLWLSQFYNSQLENGTTTLLLVECPAVVGCTGLTVGADLDVDNSGS
jgi:hypothetical protein